MLAALRWYADRAPRISGVPGGAMGRGGSGLGRSGAPDDGLISISGGSQLFAADARLDERDALIDRLGLDPAQAAARSDEALLALSWERWGERILETVSGDFSVAVWDATRRRLTLARDFLGQRALFFHRSETLLAFASMPGGLHALPAIPHRVDEVELANYVLLRPASAHRSFFSGVETVPPGHIVQIDERSTTRREYWCPPAPVSRKVTPQDASAEALHLFTRAVSARLRGSQMPGCHLSGGLDSAAVMASASLALAPEQRLTAFTATPPRASAFPAPRGYFVDEGPHAAAAAARYPNVDHILVPSAGGDPSELWDKAYSFFQEPLVNPCNFAWVSEINSEAQARKIDVLLTGQAGNLSISFNPAGYLAKLLATGDIGGLVREWLGSMRRGHSLRSLVAGTLSPLLPTRLNRRLVGPRTSFPTTDAASFASSFSASIADTTAFDIAGSYRDRDNHQRRVRALRRLDFGTLNMGVLGGWGIELRDPTADRRLVDFCLSLPDSAFHHQGTDRALARTAFKGLLPQQLLLEKRRGLQAPDWRRNVLRARERLAVELDRGQHADIAARLIDFSAARETLAGLQASDAPAQPDELRIRRGLLRALAAAHFVRRATGSNR